MQFNIITSAARGGFVPSNDLNYGSGSSVFYYTIFGHFLRLEVNKLKLWMSCYRWGKNRNALAPGRFAYLQHDVVSFERKLMDLNSVASSKSCGWKRKQQLVCERDLRLRRRKCRKENAQRKTKNNIRCGSPSKSIVSHFHVSPSLSLSLTCFFLIFVSLRNSAETRGLTSLCPKSFVSVSRINTKVVWENVKKWKVSFWQGSGAVRANTYIYICICYFWVLLLFPSALPFAKGSMLD